MGENKDITILIDIDDVINNLCAEWCLWLNNKYGTSVQYEDISEWDMAKFFPSLTKEQVFEPLYLKEFWDKVQPKQGAITYVKKLYDEGFNIFLCTSTDYKNVQIKYECIIKKYFSYINWNHVIITSCKQMIKADYLIDDAPHNLENGCYFGILYEAPHNKNYDEQSKGFIRVNNWEEIYNFIHMDIEKSW